LAAPRLFRRRFDFGGGICRPVGHAQRGELGVLMAAQLLQLHAKKEELAQAHDAQPMSEELLQAHERFQLQVRLDIENERELLYKALLVVETLVLLFVLRELLIRALS
jgi:hypothetical protein